MPRGDSGAKRAIKKHDRDHDVRAHVIEVRNQNWQDWTPCEMYGHQMVEGSCTDCGEPSAA